MGVASATEDVNGSADIAGDADSLDIAQSIEYVESDSLEIADEDNIAQNDGDALGDGGKYLNVSDAYGYLNKFRTEEGVWQWNGDDTTKTYFNTEDAVWLVPLERDEDLENVAKLRAKELVEVYDHIRPDGTYFYTAFPENYEPMGENIAYGYLSAEDVTEAWKETYDPYQYQGHRRNMLTPEYNRVGIAAYEYNGVIYWAQEFGGKYDPRPVEDKDVFYVENNNTETPGFRIEMPVYATGDFIVQINGRELMRKSMFQGKASIVIYGLKAGMYDVELVYGGDNNYESFNRTVTINATGDDSPVASFVYLNTLVKLAGDEAKLEKDYFFDAETDSDLAWGIIIPEYMTIDGQGHTVDAKGQSRIFFSMESVTLKNIRLVNAAISDFGAALLSYNLAFLENCTFINNSAGICGGAVYAVNQIHAYPSNTFINNSAGINGGALFGEAAVVAKDSTFENNRAGNLGGAIYAQGSLNSENSNYANNTNLHLYSRLTVYGNGNSWDDEYSRVFANATCDGGVVNLECDLIATQTVILNASNVVINGNGHSINASGKTRIFFATGSNLTIRNITLIGGYSVGEGGAIFAGDCDITVIDATFKDNRAETGAAISTNRGNVRILDSTFTDNTANAGGGVYSDEGNVTVTDSFFKNNDASDYGGGALYCDAKINVTGSTFIGCDSPRYGGAIFTMDKLHVSDCLFENCTSAIGGVFNSNGGGVIVNSTFADNYAKLDGGVFSASSDMSIADCNFTGNGAGKFGGVMYLFGGDTSIISSSFINNTAAVSGSVAYTKGNVTIKKSEFLNNSAPDGAINITSDEGALDADDETVYDTPLKEFESVTLGIVSADDITYGEEMVIEVNVTDNNGLALNIGSVSAVVNGKTYSANVTGKVAKIVICNLDAATYSAELTYAYDKQYPESESLAFKVNPADSSIGMVNASVIYGGSLLVSVTSKGRAVDEGSIMISVNGKNFTAPVNEGIASADISSLDAGDYTANAVYTGVNFMNSTDVFSFKVTPADSSVEVADASVVYGGSLLVSVTSKGRAVDEGSIMISVNGKNLTANVNEGIASVDISQLSAGDYNGILYYNSINFKNTTEEVSFRVFAADSSIEANACDVSFGNSVVIDVEVKSPSMVVNEGAILISIDGGDYDCEVKDGHAVIEIPDLAIGNYSGELSYTAVNFKNASKTVSFKVIPEKSDLTVAIGNITYGEKAIFNVNVSSNGKAVSGGYISVSVGDFTNRTEVIDGHATLSITNLDAGTYYASVNYIGEGKFSDESADCRFSVAKKTVTITASDKTYVINYGGKYSVTVQNAAGEKVKFTFNGKQIGSAVTDENGTAEITLTSKILKDAKAGKKNLAIELESNNYQSSKNVKITVNKEKTKITAGKKTFKAKAKTKKYSVTLKAGKNGVSKVAVYLKIKGKTYKATTNKKGTATFKIKLSKKGTFTAKITFKANSYYNKSTKSVKIKFK